MHSGHGILRDLAECRGDSNVTEKPCQTSFRTSMGILKDSLKGANEIVTLGGASRLDETKRVRTAKPSLYVKDNFCFEFLRIP